jgi:ABC-type transport system substrate-binding protein
MRKRLLFSLAVLALAAGNGTAGGRVRDGGTFRISLPGIDYVDPALSYVPWGWTLLDTVCARLMTNPDRSAPAGYRLVPEVAAGYPGVSQDRKTWTFTLRSGFRFSDGTPVKASAFARAINRTLAPNMDSPGAQYTRDIAGAEDVLAGRRETATGVIARGNTLVVRFTKPVSDFAAQTTMPFFCAVPPALPADPEGVGAFPGAGPYYVAEYRPNERIVLLRNRFYRGTRPHHVARFVVDETSDSAKEVLDQIERGDADWGRVIPCLFRPGAPAGRQVWGQQVAVLRQARDRIPCVLLQPVGFALPEQRPAQAGSQLRGRPPSASACLRRPACGQPHGSVSAARRARIRRRADLPARRA